MSKRHRPDEGAPVLSTRPAQAEGDAEEDAHALTALAGWCDDQLRDVSHLYMRERDGGAASMTCSATMHAWADDQFGGFIDALESERSVQLSEGHRGALAAAWRRGALDAARVHCMRHSFLPDSPFLKDFHFQLVAADAARDIESAAGDLFDEWIFTLGWKLARAITDMCVEVDYLTTVPARSCWARWSTRRSPSMDSWNPGFVSCAGSFNGRPKGGG